MVAVFYSDAFLEHQTGSFHPEKPARLTAIAKQLQAARFAAQLEWHEPNPERSPLPWIEQVHSAKYIAAFDRLCQEGGGHIDPDTPVSRRSFDIACLAVNAWLDGVDYAVAQREPAFILARPPGHHALPDRGMGFCLFANAAIAAHYALKHYQRVAILDWDVHHGNGTQNIVESNPHIAYCSLHQYPYYPGTGRVQETGCHSNVLNIPLNSGSTIADYEHRFHTQVMPFMAKFDPELLIISAGYDANQADPLANINLLPQDYGQLTRYCLQICPTLLFGLEGGYDLPSLAASVEATIGACLEQSPIA